MTRPGDPRAQRTHDLLADRALFGLDDADARELRDSAADADDSYDLAAAAVDLATLPIEPMPAAVAERIAAARHPRTLAGWIMPGTPGAPSAPSEPPLAASVPTSEPPPAPSLASLAPPPPFAPAPAMTATAPVAPTPPFASASPHAPVDPVRREAPVVPLARPRRRRPAFAWLAAAASLVLVVGAWWLLRGRPAPTASAARADLLAATSDATQLAWHPTREAPGTSGDVVWSPSTQRGFMRFVGLPPNDPAKTQYQLWIFDRQRDQAYPVDGGVFDVSSTGEVVVPITAKLRVGDATLFAVTVERPGGVVVSRREHIVVTAGG
ncbi:MAG TPA: anti-sigma factor [Kofleriaceae bacterium]|nr:anti-sigma factor [Kofleriaceae bacterium]